MNTERQQRIARSLKIAAWCAEELARVIKVEAQDMADRQLASVFTHFIHNTCRDVAQSCHEARSIVLSQEVTDG